MSYLENNLTFTPPLHEPHSVTLPGPHLTIYIHAITLSADQPHPQQAIPLTTTCITFLYCKSHLSLTPPLHRLHLSTNPPIRNPHLLPTPPLYRPHPSVDLIPPQTSPITHPTPPHTSPLTNPTPPQTSPITHPTPPQTSPLRRPHPITNQPRHRLVPDSPVASVFSLCAVPMATWSVTTLCGLT